MRYPQSIIVEERVQHNNEFFFDYDENLVTSAEFKRLLKYINEHSNIRISRSNKISIEQLSTHNNHGSNFCNYIVHKSDEVVPKYKEEE